VGRVLHRLRASPLSEPSPKVVDVRVGSSTDGLTPISVRERALGARLPDWLALAAVAVAAVMADQLTKRIVSGTLALGESKHVVGPLDLHHVQNSGIAFGLFAAAELVYMTYHLDWTVFLFAHTISEVLDLVAFVLVFGAAVLRVAGVRRPSPVPSRG